MLYWSSINIRYLSDESYIWYFFCFLAFVFIEEGVKDAYQMLSKAMCTMYVVVTNIKSKSIVKSNQFYSADIDIAITQAFVLLNECALKKILP